MTEGLSKNRTECMAIAKYLITGFLVFSATSVVASEGGIHLGGVDKVTTSKNGSAWFLGAQPIQACVHVADNFPLSQFQIQKIIQNSFSKWREYLDQRIAVLNRQIPLTLSIEFQESCQSNTEFQIFAGVDNELIRKSAQFLSHPLGFVQRTQYDENAGRSVGFMYVPKHELWSDESKLEAVVLHEIGHILGNVHVPGTVMREDLSLWLSEKEIPSQRLNTIDHECELLSSHELQVRSYVGIMNPKKTTEGHVFYELMGRMPKGQVLARLEWNSIPYSYVHRLNIGDSISEKQFLISKDSFVYLSHSEKIPVFKVNHAENGTLSFSNSSWVANSKMHSKTGQTFAISIAYNQVYSPWRPQSEWIFNDGNLLTDKAHNNSNGVIVPFRIFLDSTSVKNSVQIFGSK